MKLYVFGDSHAWFGWKDLELENIPVIPFELLPDSMTAAGFGFEKLNKLNILDYGVEDGDAVVFQFGETDCRAHLSNKKYREDIPNRNVLIDEIVKNYLLAIIANIEQLSNLTTMVASLYPIGDNRPPPDNYRRSLHQYFNKRIRIYCKKYQGEYNLHYLNLYDTYFDSNTKCLYKDYSDGHVHITNLTPIKQELLRIIKM